MPLSPVPRPPEPSRVAAILGRRGAPDVAAPAEPMRGTVLGDGDRLDTQLRRSRRPGLVTVPEQLRLGRLAVSTSAVVALVALVVALGCAFVLRVLWAERSAVPEPAGVRATAAGSATAGGGAVADGSAVTVTRGPGGGAAVPGGGPAAGTPGATPAVTAGGNAGQVVVHVVGQVKRPGLVRLAPGSRVADAVAAAGGARQQADLAALNLARPVTDGEQVYVPRPGETPPAPPPAPGGSGAGQAGPAGGAAAGSGSASGRVDLNTADLAALDALPGVGPVLAQRILDWRVEHGRFSSVEELREVSGIGDKLFAQLEPKVTL